MGSERPVIYRTRNLTLHYMVGKTSVEAIHPCSIEIPEGRITVIFGASGSGKSSLLNVISGLAKPSGGSIEFKGHDIYGQTKNEQAYYRAHDLGIVYQTNYWVKSLHVSDNVAMPLYFRGVDGKSGRAAAEKALQQVSMESYVHKFPILLSGGEQQRVAMARAIVGEPAVIIADEPTGALDSKNGDMIIDLLVQLCHQHGKTIILVTHNMEYLHIADHLLEVQDGTVTQIVGSDIAKTVERMLVGTRERMERLMEHKDA